jgi:maleate isomerase
MFGWRGKLGIIMPDNNTVLEPELYGYLPEGVSLHGGRALMHGVAAKDRIPTGVAALPPVIDGMQKRVGVMAYACMTTSMFMPLGYQKTLEEHTKGVPFLPAGETMVRALREVGAKRIGVFSPWVEDIASRVPAWFAQVGFEVVHNVNIPFTRDEVTGHDVVEFYPRIMREFRDKEIDAMGIMGTDWGSFPVIDLLESDLGFPVISSNLAMLWCMLGVVGVNDSIGVGTLFEHQPPSDVPSLG